MSSLLIVAGRMSSRLLVLSKCVALEVQRFFTVEEIMNVIPGNKKGKVFISISIKS